MFSRGNVGEKDAYRLKVKNTQVGYHLNMFFMSFNDSENIRKYFSDKIGYVNGFSLSEAQKQAVLSRNWLGVIALGGNMYYALRFARLESDSDRILPEIGLDCANSFGRISGLVSPACA